MDKKLTLSLDRSIIEQAKAYAKAHNVSVSKLIEAYLKRLTSTANGNSEITPLVQSLSGVIRIDQNIDYKEEYTDFLVEKHK